MTQADEGQLKRELSGRMLAIYGAGTILGAGIYVLIGKVAGEAGYWLPLAFALAALVAGVNGMVYAELATRRPAAGGPSDYVHGAFGRRWLTTAVGWMIVATGIVSAATIANGFAGYLLEFFDLPRWLAQAGLLALLGGVAAWGVRESSWFMAITTSIGVLGLLFVLWVGFAEPAAQAPASTGAWLERAGSPWAGAALAGLLSAVFLAVYAFIGFEDMVHMAEEVRRPRRAMPRAIGAAIGVAALLYVLVAIAALRVLEPQALRDAEAPLVEVVAAAGYARWPLALLSLAIIMNGALAQLIMATRVLYSLAENRGAPPLLGRVHAHTGTPLLATALAVAGALALTLFFPLQTLAAMTSFIMLLVFAVSNAALIALERRRPEAPFDTPFWLPWVGLLLSLALLGAQLLQDGGGH